MFGKKYRTQLQCKIEKKPYQCKLDSNRFYVYGPCCPRDSSGLGKVNGYIGIPKYFSICKKPHYCFFHKLPK